MAQEVVSPAAADFEERMSRKAESPLSINLKRLARKKIAMVALIFITVFYIAGITAPLIRARVLGEVFSRMPRKKALSE